MMTAPIDSELLIFAERIAAEAAAITLHWFQSRDLKVDLKKDNTEVTDADKAVEEYLGKKSEKNFLTTQSLVKNLTIFLEHLHDNG